MKKRIVLALMFVVSMSAGCADVSAVTKKDSAPAIIATAEKTPAKTIVVETSTTTVQQQQQQSAEVTTAITPQQEAMVEYLLASDWNKDPGDVASKCYIQDQKVVVYVANGNNTPPSGDHPAYARSQSLDCSKNTSERGYYKLYKANKYPKSLVPAADQHPAPIKVLAKAQPAPEPTQVVETVRVSTPQNTVETTTMTVKQPLGAVIPKAKKAKAKAAASNPDDFYRTYIKKMGFENIALFQCCNDLKVNGKLDKATRAKIEAIMKGEATLAKSSEGKCAGANATPAAPAEKKK